MSYKKTLYGAKKDGEVPTNGIYVKNSEESENALNPDIDFHKKAEMNTINILKDFNLKKDTSNPTAIDLVGEFNGSKIFIEIERNYATKSWTNESNFPYPLINIPIEKKRHFSEHRKNSFYLKYSSNLNSLFIIYGEDILKYTKEVDMNANHSGHYAKRTFLRIKKDYAVFSDPEKAEKINEFIISKI